MQRRATQHEVVGDLARLRAVEQGADQLRRGVCTPRLQAVLDGGEAEFLAGGALVDAVRRLGLDVLDGREVVDHGAILVLWSADQAADRAHQLGCHFVSALLVA
jgi:hypothetical protein